MALWLTCFGTWKDRAVCGVTFRQPFQLAKERLSALYILLNGAKAGANLYSLIKMTKGKGLEYRAYLRCVFSELPEAKALDAIDALLPYRVDNERSIHPTTPSLTSRWSIDRLRLIFDISWREALSFGDKAHPR